MTDGSHHYGPGLAMIADALDQPMPATEESGFEFRGRVLERILESAPETDLVTIVASLAIDASICLRVLAFVQGVDEAELLDHLAFGLLDPGGT